MSWPTQNSPTCECSARRDPERPVSVDYIQVLRFRDGQHTLFNLMYDRLLLQEQLGLTPAPAPAG